MKKKNVIVGAIVLLAAAGIIFKVVTGGEKPVDYETRPTVAVQKPVQGDEITLYTDLTGVIEPVSRATVQPKMSGELLEVYFQAGDYVEAGQALCKIDSDALTALRLQMESASVSADNASRELARLQPLYAGGFVSQQSYDQAQDGAKSASLAYQSAKNQYELQLEYTTVTAPISGIIESRNIEPHDHISNETELCVISGSDQVQVKFGITEKTLQNLKAGDTVDISKNGTEYQGQVTEVGSMVNSETGLYDAKAQVSQADGLTSGSRVKLTVVMDDAKDVMSIPVDAVSYDAGQAFVYCYDNGTARKTMVETGIYDAQKMEIKSGLEADSQIITSWSNELVDGVEVVLDTAQEAETPAGQQ